MLGYRDITFIIETLNGQHLAIVYRKQRRVEASLLRMVCRVPESYYNRFRELEGAEVEIKTQEVEDEHTFPSKWTEITRIRRVKK